MGYVAVKGGNEAIERACQLFAHERTKGASPPLGVDQIKEQLYLAVDRVMGEGSLYAPDLAALALKQSAGDTFEASFMLRAFRATQQRLGYSLPVSTEKMRVVRRISSAFKDIPGGQILGATSDYTLRLLDFDLLKDDAARRRAFRERIFSNLPADAEIPDTFPKVIRILRREGLLEETLATAHPEKRAFDITRQPLTFPASRSAKLQALARGETGGMLALAYSSMRGYGNIHPTLGELRIGYLPLTMPHPVTGEPYVAGEVKVTEAEVLAWVTGSVLARTRSRRSPWPYWIAVPGQKNQAVRPRIRSSFFTTSTASRRWGSVITGSCRIMWISYPIWIDSEKPRIWPVPEIIRRMPMRMHEWLQKDDEQRSDAAQSAGYPFGFMDEGANPPQHPESGRHSGIPGSLRFTGNADCPWLGDRRPPDHPFPGEAG